MILVSHVLVGPDGDMEELEIISGRETVVARLSCWMAAQQTYLLTRCDYSQCTGNLQTSDLLEYVPTTTKKNDL